jgi:uncharacterized protein
MTEAPEAVVRRFYGALEAGDHDTVRRCMSEEVSWRQAATAVPGAGRLLIGVEAVFDHVLRPLEQEWRGFTETIEELRVATEQVVVTGTYRGTHEGTGRGLEAEFCHIWRVAGGLVTEFRQFTDTAAFAEAMP